MIDQPVAIIHSPLAVANYFVKKSLETGKELTPMKLVKLVYIAHGWHLALNDGEPLINEAVEAWKYGPVVRSVYDEFKYYGKGQVTKMHGRYSGGQIPIVSDVETKMFLDKIWDVYSKFNGLQLSTLTHLPNTPWDITWNNRNGRNEYIPNELITAHYLQKASKK